MSNFKRTITTQKGHALMAKMLTGVTVEFTRITTSEHDYYMLEDFELEALAGVENEKQSVLVSDVELTNESYSRVHSVITNTELTEGYYVKAICLYANDPDEGEILYSITVCESGKADWLPPFNTHNVSSIEVNLDTVISNAKNVSLEVNPAALISVKTFNKFKDDVTSQLNEIVYLVDNYSSIQECFDNAKEGSTIKFTNAKTYNIDTINLTKSINVDFNNCIIHTNKSRINNFLNINSNQNQTAIATKTSNNKITLDDSVSCNVDDLVYIIDNTNNHLIETNKITAINANELTLQYDLNRDYASGLNVTLIKSIKNITIKNANIFENNDDTVRETYYHLFKLYGVENVKIENINLNNWKMHGFNFNASINVVVKNSKGYSTTSKAEGEGYFCRFIGCRNSYLKNCIAYDVRHMFDVVGGSDSYTENNICYNSSESAFALHGHYSIRTYSENDKAYNCNIGWALGNPSFNSDEDIIINDFVYTGTYASIAIYNGSKNIYVNNVKAVSSGVALEIGEVGDIITIINSEFKTGDSYSCRIISASIGTKINILNSTFETSATRTKSNVYVNTAGDFTFDNCYISNGQYCFQIGHTTPPSLATIKNSKMLSNGSNPWGIMFNSRPKDKAIIKQNKIETTNGIYLNLNANDIIEDNQVNTLDAGGSITNYSIQNKQIIKKLVTLPMGSVVPSNSLLNTEFDFVGAVKGDTVILSPMHPMDGLMFLGYVSNTDKVTVRIQNVTSMDNTFSSYKNFYCHLIKNNI